MDQHQIYKVETAGDAYLAAGGLMTTDEDGFTRVDPHPDPVVGAQRVLQVGPWGARHACSTRYEAYLPQAMPAALRHTPVLTQTVLRACP